MRPPRRSAQTSSPANEPKCEGTNSTTPPKLIALIRNKGSDDLHSSMSDTSLPSKTEEPGSDEDSESDSKSFGNSNASDDQSSIESVISTLSNRYEVVFHLNTIPSDLSNCTTLTPSTTGSTEDGSLYDDGEEDSIERFDEQRHTALGEPLSTEGTEEGQRANQYLDDDSFEEDSSEVELKEQIVDTSELLNTPTQLGSVECNFLFCGQHSIYTNLHEAAQL
mmetsp:Transcript_52152/g.156540  ORF Transcript_52152/g.156540 Transcript_52152/m.156540 type:complete len:222 (-) Transcript_52152:147-812(-)